MFIFVDKKDNKAGILDTRDNKIDYITPEQVKKAILIGLKIQGVEFNGGSLIFRQQPMPNSVAPMELFFQLNFDNNFGDYDVDWNTHIMPFNVFVDGIKVYEENVELQDIKTAYDKRNNIFKIPCIIGNKIVIRSGYRIVIKNLSEESLINKSKYAVEFSIPANVRGKSLISATFAASREDSFVELVPSKSTGWINNIIKTV